MVRTQTVGNHQATDSKEHTPYQYNQTRYQCKYSAVQYLSLYSVVRSAWVTPSMESMMGQAKSYVGYALYLMPVRRCGVSLNLIIGKYTKVQGKICK